MIYVYHTICTGADSLSLSPSLTRNQTPIEKLLRHIDLRSESAE